jgi:hypothetical protein
VNVDTQEWLFVRGQVNGLTVALGALAERTGQLDTEDRALRYRLGRLDTDILAALTRMSDQLDRHFGIAPDRAALSVIEGGRPGGRHAAPRGKLRSVQEPAR